MEIGGRQGSRLTTDRDECFETKSGETKAKTIATFLVEKIDAEQYKRQPREPISKLNRHEAKVLILARFHMLECGKNFKGTLPEICPTSHVTDNEQHRLNYSIRFRDTILCDHLNKLNFDDIYQNDLTIVKNVIQHIEKVWNLKTGQECMVQIV